MLSSYIIILIVVAVLLLIATYEWKDPVIDLVDSIIWFIVALGVLSIELPYTVVIGGVITTGVNTITSMMYTSYLFGMLGIVMFVAFVTHTLQTLKGFKEE